MFSLSAILSRLRIAVLFFLITAHFTCAGAAGSGSLLWTYRSVTGNVDATPAAADVDGDGITDVVMATTGGTVLATDARGHIKWQYDIHHTVSTPVCLAGRPLRVYVLTNPGSVICLDARRGEKLWEYIMPAGFVWGTTAPAAADLDGDGVIEVIVADRGGHLVALTPEGAPLWKTDYAEGFRSAPALADLDGDGKKEILLGTEKKMLVCFSHKGKELWHSGGKAAGSSPLVIDLDGDGRPEILTGNKEGLVVSNNGGDHLWLHTMKGSVHDAITAADINGDGKKEVIVVDLRGDIACLAHDGRLLWTARVAARARRSPTVGDVDGDGRPEILVGSYAGSLSIFDNEGNVKQEIPLHGGMNSSPLLVDFRHDGRPAIVCATTADVVTMSMLRKKEDKGSILCGSYRLNAARTGTLLPGEKQENTRTLTVDYGTLHTGVNHFTVTVHNPAGKTLTLRMSLSKGQGNPLSTLLTSTDTLFAGKITYSIPGDAPLSLHFSYQLSEKGKPVARHSKNVYLIPFAKDLEDLQQLLTTIRQNCSRLEEKEGVEQQLLYLEKVYGELAARSRLAGVMSPLERATLRTQYEKAWLTARRWAGLTGAALDAGGRLAVYAANPWAPFGGVDEIMEGRTPPPHLTIEAFGGEKESAALNIANYSDRPVTVRIEPSPLYNGDSTASRSFRKVISFHEVVSVPTHSLDLSADALPRMNQGRTVTLAPWSMRQVWITVDASQLAAGRWTTRIRCRTLEVEPAEDIATLDITVWPVSLTQKDPLRLCHWGYVSRSVLSDMPAAALQDQVDHGTNVFVAISRWVPRATFDSTGMLTGQIDFSAHDEYVREHAPHGLILFSGYQGVLKGPAGMLSPLWIKAYKQWIMQWRDHLFSLGLGYGDFAFYPIDEPGLREGLVDRVVALARPIKEVDARLQVYADPVGRATLEDLKKMAPYLDIWCPNRNGYLLHEGNDKLAFIKSTGKTVWTYECEGDAKHQSPLGYYRSQSWLVWWHGLTGIGFWSYCTSQHDPWYVPGGGQDYLLIYQGDGVVTSKRWEAVRDGKEDYNMLAQLKATVEQPPPGADPNVVKDASRFLREKTYVIASYCGLDKDGTLPVAEGMAATRKIEDRRWHTLQRTRREMAALLIKLTRPGEEP